MIKVKDGYAKLIGTTYQGSATQVLLSNGGDLKYSASSKANTLVQRNASQYIYATYFNSAISDEALTDIGSVYVRNTSDTFIRRVSKTQFYSILDDKFVTLDTTQSITGAKTFSTSVRFANNASIIQNQNNTSNYTTILKWYKNGASRNTYDPSIGQHNTGGDGNGSICILPYPTKTSPQGGMVGLFISKGVLKLDGKSVALAENYYTKTESNQRYVTSLGTSGNYLTWTKNGVVNNLTVPYATASSRINSSSSVQNTGLTYYSSGGFVVGGTAAGGQWGMPSDSQDAVFKNGQCLRMYWGSTYYTDILSGPNNMGTTKGLYMRQIVNGAVATGTFAGGWRLILDSYNYRRYGDTRYVTSLGTNGTYVTWVKNGTTNNITVPYATNSKKANYIYYGSISNLNSPSSWTSDGYRLVYDTYSGSASNKPLSQGNANGIITLFKSKHGTSNQYVSQLAFPNNTRMYYRYASAGSFSPWYTIAYTSDINDPANYYWANVKVSASSNSRTSPTFNTCYTSNWFRSTGNTGWYSESYGGGWYMTDSTWIRTYGSRSVYQNTGQIRTDGYLVTNRGITVGATSPNNNTYKSHVTGNSWSSGYIRAGAGFYHNSVNSNNYVLLAGGSYKSLADFAKGNAGASNRGVYVTNGTVTAMTHYLNATINSGASGKLAYYKGPNFIDDYINNVGSSYVPIHLSSGVPTACTGVMVKYWASYTINNYNGTSVTYVKHGGTYNFITSASRRDTGRYTIGTVYPPGQTWYTTWVWAVGNLNTADSRDSSKSLLYCTLIRGYTSGSAYYWFVNTADDASTNNGSFTLFFLSF